MFSASSISGAPLPILALRRRSAWTDFSAGSRSTRWTAKLSVFILATFPCRGTFFPGRREHRAPALASGSVRVLQAHVSGGVPPPCTRVKLSPMKRHRPLQPPPPHPAVTLGWRR